MQLSSFDYTLPKELIAQYPLEERDASRMMIVERVPDRIYERKFTDIVGYLRKGDTLVLNDAKVINARLLGTKETGAKIELLLLERIRGATYKVLAKPSKRLKTGSRVVFGAGLSAKVLENADIGKIVEFSGEGDIDAMLKNIGEVPLPPYIKRDPEPLDEERYQTVYARSSGATASPTAGLHFTQALLAAVRAKGIMVASVTLHVSYGTFAPVLEQRIENHAMHKEYFELTSETAQIINETKKRGSRVIAVGTTATRVLESCAGAGGVAAREGYTDLFIYPGYTFKVVNALLTNFHLPKSTLLMLVCAFAGREVILDAYRQAIESKFRFFSYGDCMLIV